VWVSDPRSGRLPTRSRLRRDLSLCAVVSSAQPAPGQCHRRRYYPFYLRQVTMRRHRPKPADTEQVVSASTQVKPLLLSPLEDKNILGGGWTRSGRTMTHIPALSGASSEQTDTSARSAPGGRKRDRQCQEGPVHDHIAHCLDCSMKTPRSKRKAALAGFSTITKYF